MSKKKARKTRRIKPARAKLRRPFILIVACLGITLCLGTFLGPWRASNAAQRIRNVFISPVPPPPAPPANAPSKEYVYAGSRLIATEEPPSAPLAPPTSMTATSLTSLPVAQVSISWTAAAGADHYQVERTFSIGGSYTMINDNVTTTTFADNTVSSVTAYLYRVRAVNSVGNFSPYSNLDVATAISFTDDSLQPAVTAIKSQHISELRQAVNAVRATAGLAAANWAEGVGAGVTVKSAHFQELRTKLDEARSALGLAACSYTSASPGVLIQKAHVDQLRQCVR